MPMPTELDDVGILSGFPLIFEINAYRCIGETTLVTGFWQKPIPAYLVMQFHAMPMK